METWEWVLDGADTSGLDTGGNMWELVWNCVGIGGYWDGFAGIGGFCCTFLNGKIGYWVAPRTPFIILKGWSWHGPACLNLELNPTRRVPF